MTLPVYYLSIDPGKTTGWVEAAAYDALPVELELVEDAQVTPENITKKLRDWELRTWGQPRRVLCESFISLSTEFHVDANWSCQLIGCIRLLCAQYEVELVMRAPQARKQISPETLKSSGYWRSGGKDDKREATKHLLAYLVELHHQPTMEQLYPR